MRPGPGNRRTRTTARLLSAAFTVFAAKGYGRVSIEDVCAAAGYTRGAFYSNFGSLGALFHALYEERAAVLCRRVTAVLHEARTGAAPAMTERVSEVLLSEPRWLLLEADFRAYSARRPEAARAHRDARRRLAETIAGGLTAHRASAPAGHEEAVRAVLEAYDAVTAQLLLDGDAERARERLAYLLSALTGRGEDGAGRRAGPGRAGQSLPGCGSRAAGRDRSAAAGSP
ncbi:TetR/AcrR family transcriptional regulator [Streptomyces fumanus]|uniref:TetR family transcriptional regulator n=1 Tax=Streptomyces fumanus TaxID=67302 RepID=A0A919AZZ8_9ACTN|nr:TetR/AcrR family transcriptional regulator [Streptomyces fumanus]GHF35426.1 TetR family transcriptional regulator [Streptomyces fumanus]